MTLVAMLIRVSLTKRSASLLDFVRLGSWIHGLLAQPRLHTRRSACLLLLGFTLEINRDSSQSSGTVPVRKKKPHTSAREGAGWACAATFGRKDRWRGQRT